MDADQKLHLEGMREPIRTHVTRRSHNGLTVEQALPFLKLNTRVHDDSRREAHIQSVSMVVTEGMPRLVLDLVYAAEAVAQIEAHAVQASDGEPFAPAVEAPGVPRPGIARPRQVDQTQPFEVVAPETRESIQAQVLGRTDSLRDDGSVVFKTSGAQQLTLEEQLLRSHTISFRLEQTWRRAKPRLEIAAWTVWKIARIVDARLRPLLLAGGRLAGSLTAAAASRLLAGLRQLRLRLAERRKALPRAASEDVDPGQLPE